MSIYLIVCRYGSAHDEDVRPAIGVCVRYSANYDGNHEQLVSPHHRDMYNSFAQRCRTRESRVCHTIGRGTRVPVFLRPHERIGSPP